MYVRRAIKPYLVVCLAISILMHLGFISWGLFSPQSTPLRKPPEPAPLDVSTISPDELTRVKHGDRDAKKIDVEPQDGAAKKEAAKPKTVTAAAPPPAAEPAPPPVPPPEPAKPEPPKEAATPPPELAPGPTPEELKKLEDERRAEEQRKADEKRRAEEKKKADAEKKRKEAERKKREEQKKLAEAKKKAEEQKKKQFDADNIAALLNKIPDKGAPGVGTPAPSPKAQKGRTAGAPEGRDSSLTASQAALLGTLMKRAVSRCWNINSGLEGVDKVVVKIEVMLTPEGRLAQPPRVVNSGTGTLFADAANSAVRALVLCEPYDLPQDFYKGGWDHMIVTFDPQRMF